MAHDDAIAALREEVDLLRSTQAGLLTIIAALVATHPNYRHMQMTLVSTTEVLLGRLTKQMRLETARQKEIARAVCEFAQQIHEAPAGSSQRWTPPPPPAP